MAVRIVHASKDENGRYTGGIAGDQTGQEVCLRVWYNRPWDTVLRALDPLLASHIASTAHILAKCVKIGYDQYQRTTLYDQCEKINWDISRINDITPCECDCSSLIAVILRFCGVSIPKTVYTGNMTSYVLGTGKFECLRDPKYLTQDAYLKKGDIILNTAHHVAVVIDDGEKAQIAFTAYAAQVKVNTYLQVRTAPNGAEYKFSDGTSYRLPNGMTVAIVQESAGWGRLSDIQGWVSLSYLVRATS